MKKITKLTLFFSILFCSLTSIAQTENAKIEKGYIEVNGSSEMQIVPDEIYIQINLQERYEGKMKITMDTIENQFWLKLKGMGIDLKNLSLSDANSDFVKIKRAKKDVLTSKEYTLKVSTAKELSKVYDELSKIKIQDLRIDKVKHSKMEEFKKQVKTEAIKAAKEKAGYLLAAIGEQLGRPLSIIEQDMGYAPVYYANSFEMKKNTANGFLSSSMESQEGLPDEVGFQKIRIEYKILSRFEIK